MRTVNALVAFALLAGSAEASHISLAESPRGRDAKGVESRELSAWSQFGEGGDSGRDGVFSKDAVSVDYGLDLSFRYSMGDEKDGFSFLVLDAKRSAETGRQEAILGLEFTRDFGGSGKNGEDRWSRDVISLRGPGNGTEKELTEFGFANYGLIATTGDFEAASMRGDEGWKTLLKRKTEESRDTEVRVDTTQLGDERLPVTVWMADEDGERVLVAKYDAFKEVSAYYGGAKNIPTEMNIGFSGSTGGAGNFANFNFTLAQPGTETPEPSTLLLGMGGSMVALGVGLRRRRR